MTDKKKDSSRAHHLKLGDHHARAGQFHHAVPHYRAATKNELDGHVGYRLAVCEYLLGDLEGALATLGMMGPGPAQQDREEVPILRAEILIELGEVEFGTWLLSGMVPHVALLNAYFDYVDLSLEFDRRDDAKDMLEAIERMLDRVVGPLREELMPLFSRAMEQLRELRAQP